MIDAQKAGDLRVGVTVPITGAITFVSMGYFGRVVRTLPKSVVFESCYLSYDSLLSCRSQISSSKVTLAYAC